MMAVSPALKAERSRIHEELVAGHTLMRRGAALVVTAFTRLADGEPVDVRTLIATTRWLIDFVGGQRASEVRLFWPVLRELFPGPVAELDRTVAERDALEAELHALDRSVNAIAAREVTGGRAEALAIISQATMSGLPSAQRVQTLVNRHFDEEEPVLLELIPRVPDRDVARLRCAILQSAPRTGPHLVFGLLEDPDRLPGHTALMSNFPASVRLLRPVLLARYRSVKRALGVSELEGAR
ncbi:MULTISPECIES: hemerythrin domain-containing protein [unclassified Streptomyces]|uniref:hemerythrin domain-containing protein n=1 Tax=unclassified Streptomyces TaxID=2593676 RepID=UPI002E2AB5CD|nr:hemerythrin domain-containing protein [Streptomyces sp. NBC_01429]